MGSNDAPSSQTHQTPMLRRWLGEEKWKGGDNFEDRERYTKGEAGMRKYLVSVSASFFFFHALWCVKSRAE